MWGGWYEDENIMEDLKKMKKIAESSVNKNTENYPQPETVMLIDEKAYLNIPRNSELCHSVNITRIEMGNTGIPFDLCMAEDAEKVLHKYKAAIFTAPLPSEAGKRAIEFCKELGIPYIEATEKKPYSIKNELREFLISNGVHCYNEDNNVIYCGNGFLGIHTVNDGEVKITLPNKYKIRTLFGADFRECKTDIITLYMKKHDTAIFELV